MSKLNCLKIIMKIEKKRLKKGYFKVKIQRVAMDKSKYNHYFRKYSRIKA